jgi:hypothetical protein
VKADVEVIIRELELEISQKPTDVKPQPAYLAGEDTFFSIGGGLSLLNPFPLVSAVGNFGIVEAQARLGGLDFIFGGIDVGVLIVTSPRKDQSEQSLLNISAGLTGSPLFNRENNNDIISTATTINAGVYGANSFYINCKFSVRTELQVAARVFQRQTVDGVPIDLINQEFDLNLFLNAFAHYNIQRDPCPK